MKSTHHTMTPTPDHAQRALAKQICLITDDGMLALKCHDGSIINPLIGEPYSSLILDTIAHALADAVAQEREACAALIEQRIGLSFTLDDELHEIARAIRKRQTA